ncbi:MAG: Asp-tRNA(Asn)/Glu-tRNA(Gln) amidotransferase subunit GatB, partial [Geopsychrobacter sp.]|nr:Asp-tRNA(Asn)/Glu-tRNA(Gln) amidotransferase subunit GatB [Geopsychrobacter sp.]
MHPRYEVVIGLEVHAQIISKSKLFSGSETSFGAEPNTHVSLVDAAMPGMLPVINKYCVEQAVKTGLGLKAEINLYSVFDRKNYFYPDLPKGYQITQFETPICTEGRLRIRLEDGDKWIGITRIHIEEDAGKSMHDIDPYYTLIDLNRAGVPLLEIVSEPDMKSPEEAYRYLTEIRKLVRYLEICDGNMEEGSLRCDANVSVMLKGSKEYGQKVEVKNMNSIRNVANALRYEVRRQIEALERGESIDQDTRSFDPVEGITHSMRSKEMEHDYRYFTEPDLPPLYITKEMIDEVQDAMPPLPDELFLKYVNELGLTEYDAGVLTGEKDIALFFEELITKTGDYKAAANWVMGPVKSYLN